MKVWMRGWRRALTAPQALSMSLLGSPASPATSVFAIFPRFRKPLRNHLRRRPGNPASMTSTPSFSSWTASRSFRRRCSCWRRGTVRRLAGWCRIFFAIGHCFLLFSFLNRSWHCCEKRLGCSVETFGLGPSSRVRKLFDNAGSPPSRGRQQYPIRSMGRGNAAETVPAALIPSLVFHRSVGSSGRVGPRNPAPGFTRTDMIARPVIPAGGNL
jgi:hypothetical protein